MTKIEKIQEAYGENWEKVKDFVYENGWCSTRKNIDFENIRQSFEIEYKRFTTYHWRPISLKGIETNRGWIKIESEADLPKTEDEFWVFDNKGNCEKLIKQIGLDSNSYWWMKNVTHYQPIIKPLPPIY